jgi:hypothetical protein
MNMSSLKVKSPSQVRARALSNRFFSASATLPRRMLCPTLVLFLAGLGETRAPAQLYLGAAGGVSTLSSDARSGISSGSIAFSSYDPRNGGAVEILVGNHFSDYFTAQGEYIWNRNRLVSTSAAFIDGTEQAYREVRGSSEHSLLGDLLVYFRRRDSRLRPYLSVGSGVVHLSSSRERLDEILGAPQLPPKGFSSNTIALHVPVGMDVRLGKGWAFRYSFSETLGKNALSNQLSPPGQHSLKNFESLFGLLRQF